MILFLLGAIAMASFAAGLLFLRSWKRTNDTFFLFFAASFTVEGINRALLAFHDDASEGQPLFYLVRFFSFLLILIAIIRKNMELAGRDSKQNRRNR